MLVDDYDLVAAGPTNPLQPLLEYLPQARDIGLHLVITRRSGGAGRALYDPVIQRLRELSSPGLMMSGAEDEGALLGRPARAAAAGPRLAGHPARRAHGWSSSPTCRRLMTPGRPDGLVRSVSTSRDS